MEFTSRFKLGFVKLFSAGSLREITEPTEGFGFSFSLASAGAGVSGGSVSFVWLEGNDEFTLYLMQHTDSKMSTATFDTANVVGVKANNDEFEIHLDNAEKYKAIKAKLMDLKNELCDLMLSDY